VSPEIGAGVMSLRDAQPAVFGVVLVGGKSVRMGRDKRTLGLGGSTFAEQAVAAMKRRLECVVLAGSGSIPKPLAELQQLADAAGVAGPLAGVLAAMRWASAVAWVVAACDMPEISSDSIDWLLGQRRQGVWAVLPTSSEGQVEPLLSIYEPQALSLLEEQAAAGRWGLRHLVGHERVRCPTPPAELMAAWADVNTPQELKETANRLYDGVCRAQ